MLSQGGVYYLIWGVIVQVVQEDKASGLSQVHWDGIVANLWTPSTFLSKHRYQHIGDYRNPLTANRGNQI